MCKYNDSKMMVVLKRKRCLLEVYAKIGIMCSAQHISVECGTNI